MTADHPASVSNRRQSRRLRRSGSPFLLAAVMLVSITVVGCAPTPEANVLGYLLADRLGTLQPSVDSATGTLSGRVRSADRPVAGATVVLSDRSGQTVHGHTDAAGEYTISNVPVGAYVPAAVARGYAETALSTSWGGPALVVINSERLTVAPDLHLTRRGRPALPPNLTAAVDLTQTGVFTATSVFPPGSAARVESYQFVRNGVVNDTLRLYLPQTAAADDRFPLIFAVYPGVVDGWQSVSVGFAAQGFALVAISPTATWGVDVEQHAADAALALELARSGALGPHIAAGQAVALGGSFSSAILHRLLRDVGDQVAAWVTVGGISDAYAGAAAFYRGDLDIPAGYQLVIPALGNPRLNPVPFLRFSPVFTADELPPTLIIHTAADRIIPIAQAFALQDALEQAGVLVETFYYDDVSHYLQIDEQMPAVSRQMFYRVLAFVREHGTGAQTRTH